MKIYFITALGLLLLVACAKDHPLTPQSSSVNTGISSTTNFQLEYTGIRYHLDNGALTVWDTLYRKPIFFNKNGNVYFHTYLTDQWSGADSVSFVRDSAGHMTLQADYAHAPSNGGFALQLNGDSLLYELNYIHGCDPNTNYDVHLRFRGVISQKL